MKKWLSLLTLLAGCGPIAVDFSASLGSNQTIEKTLKINQKQTKAQAEAGSDFWDSFFTALPLVGASVPPSPTPTPIPTVHSITIQMAPTPEPTPERIITRPASPRARRLPPAKTVPKVETMTVVPGQDCAGKWNEGFGYGWNECEKQLGGKK